MSDRSTIEWTDATWNPVTGCSEVSPGCDNCYAKTFAERWRGTPGHYFENGFDVQLRPDKLDQPLRWRRPRKVFVNSMSDLFHKDVPDDYIAKVFAVMSLAPQHTFQVLTKRHGRMRSLLASPSFRDLVDREWCSVPDWHHGRLPESGPWPGNARFQGDWPLPNVWLGVSVENQTWADIRIPALAETAAAVRFLSCEPLLGPVNMRLPTLNGRIHWVIGGGESGRAARPMNPEWARSLRDQCTEARVPFLFKQWGEWVTESQSPQDILLPATSWRHLGIDQPRVYKVGKGAAGRELDGRTWDEYP